MDIWKYGKTYEVKFFNKVEQKRIVSRKIGANKSRVFDLIQSNINVFANKN